MPGNGDPGQPLEGEAVRPGDPAQPRTPLEPRRGGRHPLRDPEPPQGRGAGPFRVGRCRLRPPAEVLLAGPGGAGAPARDGPVLGPVQRRARHPARARPGPEGRWLVSGQKGMAAVEEYLGRLGKAFDHVPPAERDDIVAEVRSHIMERIEEQQRAGDDVVDDVLRAVGDPAELARQHRTETMLRQAERSRSPWLLLRSTLRWATTGSAGLVAVFVALLGYGCGVVCWLSALLKPLFPARIGLWLQPGQMLT